VKYAKFQAGSLSINDLRSGETCEGCFRTFKKTAELPSNKIRKSLSTMRLRKKDFHLHLF
jgi:hypothetical protein